eukprot:1159966-Pelagomonas_calceolata.AAC.7
MVNLSDTPLLEYCCSLLLNIVCEQRSTFLLQLGCPCRQKQTYETYHFISKHMDIFQKSMYDADEYILKDGEKNAQ